MYVIIVMLTKEITLLNKIRNTKIYKSFKNLKDEFIGHMNLNSESSDRLLQW